MGNSKNETRCHRRRGQCQWNFIRLNCIFGGGGRMAHSFRNFQNIPILISNTFEEVFVLLTKMVFYNIAVSRKRRFVSKKNIENSIMCSYVISKNSESEIQHFFFGLISVSHPDCFVDSKKRKNRKITVYLR